jgi:hypothetical protein
LKKKDISEIMKSISMVLCSNAWLVHLFPWYYGWIIAVLETLGGIINTPGQTYGVSIFYSSYIVELDLSKSLVSYLYSIGTLGGGLTLPFLGAAIDSFGKFFFNVGICSCLRNQWKN